MTVHASIEQLSSYLDAELAARDREQLEDHLEECPSCRSRLAGLRGVVRRLQRLESQAPPVELEFQVERRIAVEADREGLRGRLEETVKGLLLQPSLMPVFGLVVALALILYLFSFGLARFENGGTQLVIPSQPTDSVQVVFDREFVLRDGVWTERGLSPASVTEVVDLRGVEAAPPDWAPFAALGDRVRLTHRGVVVELLFR